MDMAKGAHKQADYLAINPRGKVPALEIDGVCWDSNAALEYLAIRESPLAQGAGRAHRGALADAHGVERLSEARRVYFFNRVLLPRAGRPADSERLAKAARKMSALLTLLDDRLEGRDYLPGDFTLVDCAYAPWPHPRPR